MERVVQDVRNESTIHSWQDADHPFKHTHTHPMVLLMGAWVITQSGRGGKVSLRLPPPLLSVTSHTSYCSRLKPSRTLSAWCREKYNVERYVKYVSTLFPEYKVWLKHVKCHVQRDCGVQFGLVAVDIGKTNRNEGKTVNLITSRSLLKPY